MGVFHRKFNHAVDKTEKILLIQKKVRAFIRVAQYKTAYKFLTKEVKKYQDSYYIASMLATLNAEDAFVLSDSKKKKAFSLAAKKLRILLCCTQGATEGLKSRNINEYYWFSEQHKKQYLFGVKRVSLGNVNGLYSQGVGAANFAHKLFSEGKKTTGLRWAQKSQLAWEEYFEKVGNNYHDPWYWYALALGLQRKDKEFNVALKKCAKLARKNIKTDLAFKKLRKMISARDKKG